MEAIEAFDNAMERVDFLCNLYENLRNTRKRNTRTDWARNFKTLMHWPQGEQIHRIDGTGAVLILRQTSSLQVKQFAEDVLGELSRAALVTAVSALDRYCHEVVLSRVITELRKPVSKMSADCKKMEVSVIDAIKAIENAKVRKGKGGKTRTRPMNIIRHSLQEKFHRNRTMQKPDDIAKSFSMVGIEKIWEKCSKQMASKPEDMKKRLAGITHHRDKIVHEGDIVRHKRGGKVKVNPIDHASVKADVVWIRQLVTAVEAVI